MTPYGKAREKILCVPIAKYGNYYSVTFKEIVTKELSRLRDLFEKKAKKIRELSPRTIKQCLLMKIIGKKREVITKLFNCIKITKWPKD